MAKVYNPPVGFYFKLSFKDDSVAFKEVSGLTMEMDTEETEEGGSNRYKYRLPTTAKFSNLVLKRGLASKDSKLVNWCINTLAGNLSSTTIEPKTITVTLLNENGLPLRTWNFANAWPVKWAVAELNNSSNEILIETLEFAYNYFEVKALSNNNLSNLFD